MDEWLKAYRLFTADELEDEIDKLKKLADNPFQSQQEGARAYTRSTAETRDRLTAALTVRNERSGSGEVSWRGTADFSGV